MLPLNLLPPDKIAYQQALGGMQLLHEAGVTGGKLHDAL